MCNRDALCFFAVGTECLNIIYMSFGFIFWIQVSMQPEGPTTGHIDYGFPWFSSVLEQMLSWYRNLHFSSLASHVTLRI
jgi:hypothetical protein